MVREWRALAARVMQAAVMGALLGSIFQDSPVNTRGATLRLSVVLYAQLLLAFANMGNVGVAAGQRAIVLKQARAGSAGPGSWALAAALSAVPACGLESVVLMGILYASVGFANEPQRVVTLLGIPALTDWAIGVFFTSLGVALPSGVAAEALAAPCTGIMVLFSGYLVTRAHVPSWLTPLYFGCVFTSLSVCAKPCVCVCHVLRFLSPECVRNLARSRM
jgi:hypothetical protein